MNPLEFFSPDHRAARQRFRLAAEQLNLEYEEHPIGDVDPNGEPLAFDVACTPGRRCDQTLVISCGIHGVEAYVGSAIQLALFENWKLKRTPIPDLNVVFLHGLNAYGFAWHRRFDENNVDPNRNFLLPGESYAGSPPGYSKLNSLLNPESPPSRFESFTLKLAAAQFRLGRGPLRQAIAAGQYEFPKGIFFGGTGPSTMHELVRQHLPRWIKGATQVMHLDFHTGLGRWGDYKLLIDTPLSDAKRNQLAHWYGEKILEESDPQGIAYESRGGFDRWCSQSGFADDYVALCAEFGTYGVVKMLAGVRAENQTQQWEQAESQRNRKAKNWLRELFCPASPSWRAGVLEKSLNLIDQTIRGLENRL